MDAAKGWQGDLAKHTVGPVLAGAKMPEEPTVWLPTERMAKAWVAVENGTPFEK
jgi:hypothetical protein